MTLLKEFHDDAEIDGSAIELSDDALDISNTLHLAFADFTKRHSNGRCILMLDPTLRDAADDPYFAEALSGYEQAHSLPAGGYKRILWQHPNLVPQHRPYLIPLNLNKFSDARLLSISIEFALADWDIDARHSGQGHRICGWLFSEDSISDLCQYFGRQAVQRKENGKHVFLRFFDPSVMMHLWEISTEEQRSKLFGSIAHWFMLGMPDQAQKLKAYSPKPTANAEIQSLHYTDNQWSQIENIAPLNQALNSWQSDSDNIPSDIDITNSRNALIRARSYGLSKNEDLKIFALHNLSIHSKFDQHTLVMSRIKNLAHDSSYNDLISTLKTSDWEKIKTDMNNSNFANQ